MRLIGEMMTDYNAGYVDGAIAERQKMLDLLSDYLKSYENHPTKLDTFEAAGIYRGLKRAQLLIKEAK
jgi:hypothetical protein